MVEFKWTFFLSFTNGRSHFDIQKRYPSSNCLMSGNSFKNIKCNSSTVLDCCDEDFLYWGLVGGNKVCQMEVIFRFEFLYKTRRCKKSKQRNEKRAVLNLPDWLTCVSKSLTARTFKRDPRGLTDKKRDTFSSILCTTPMGTPLKEKSKSNIEQRGVLGLQGQQTCAWGCLPF